MTLSERNCRRKKSWSTRVKAQVHALGVMNNPVPEFRSKAPIHVYQCPHCHRWHLTRKPPSP